MKILLVDQPIANRGDESAHRGLMRAICKAIPNVEIIVLHINNDVNKVAEFNVNLPQVKYVNIEGLNKGLWSLMIAIMKHDLPSIRYIHPTMVKIIRYYKETDIVMGAPGGINMGGFHDWRHLFLLMMAKWYKKPLVYYGRSIGPFSTDSDENKKFQNTSKVILQYASFLCLRDKQSVAWAHRLGVECIPTVDSAFLDSPSVGIPKEITDTIGDSKFIVFVPNALTWHYAFKEVSNERIMDFFCRMIDVMLTTHPDYKVVMLPQTYGQGKRNDVLFFRKIAGKKKDSRIVVIDDTYSSDIQQTVISKSELVIGARYHSIVFAINNNVPFISLSYEHKMAGLLESLGIEHCMLDITHSFSSKESEDSSLKLFKNKLENVQLIEEAQSKAKKIASDCFGKFIEFAKENKQIWT